MLEILGFLAFSAFIGLLAWWDMQHVTKYPSEPNPLLDRSTRDWWGPQ